MPGWDEHPRAGYPEGDPYDMPADLAAVQADDALLDIIGAGHTPSHADDELTRVLAAWRREVHAEPVPELVDTSTALAVIRAAARQPARRRNPLFGSAAAAAAVLVIFFSGMGLVAKSAQPGDNLWGVTQVLYKEYARSVETAAAVRTELNEANAALKQHNPQRAREALQRVQQQLPVIGEAEGLTDLTARHRQLEQRLLTGTPDTGPANVPGAPASPSSESPGAEPKASEVRRSSESSAPVEATTTPESAKNLTGPSTPNSSQFLPDRYPQGYYPPPGAPSDSGPPDGDRLRDGRHPGGGVSGNGNTSGGGVPSPSPSPGAGPGSIKEPGSGFAGGPQPPRTGFRPVCEHPSPQPPYCG